VDKFLPVGAPDHPLGTDHLGRDHLARLLYGGQVSLSVGLASASFATTIGILIGLIAGYYTGGPAGIVDDLIMWFITTLNSIPTLMLLILLASVLNPTVTTLIMVLTLISWTGTMRLVRGETLSQRNREYIVAARALGAGDFRIMFRHILPNILSILVVSLALQIGTLILVESALSFLGLGVREPTPSWGNMLTKAQSAFRQNIWLSVIPGLLISTTVLCLYVIGDGLRDAFDPQATKK
jgi:peptide/nickel transport system permease protein